MKKEQVNTQPARGMRDFLPADVRKREYVIGIIKEVYESYGFEPLETPTLENLETLMGKYGEEGNQLIYKVLKRGEKLEEGAATKDLADLALRYDLTVPLARVVAHHRNELPKFFKRYQIQPVWRADRPAKGRYREFYQCDVDAIGSESMVVEAELISAVSEILERLGFDDFVIRINHRKILTAILDVAGVPESKHTDALVALDKIDKIGREGVQKELQTKGIAKETEAKLFALFEFFIKGKSSETFNETQKLKIADFHKQIRDLENSSDQLELFARDFLTREDADWKKILAEIFLELTPHFRNWFITLLIENFVEKHPSGKKGLSDLQHILGYVNQVLVKGHVVGDRIKIDPSLARGLSYYTGAIMEVNVPDLAGSLAGGGRYDGLIGMFGKEQIPACGISIGLERIIVVMEERGMFPPEIAVSSSADVMVTIWNEESVGESLKLASELRAAGHRVLVYPEADKLGKQFKYAGQIGVPYVCVIGESELADGTVTVKNMASGEQETTPRDTVAAKIAGK